ncbi:hypothetical protein EOD42_09215 [Rhodovarius crocodyli]|uniref:Uncharacterized protein n=1 Tax=Rhodovarius crocodyli TaxID=1979269 RepID=A0A437MG35_9PROT|nr:hypothetical protein EOD42_09215 [Rhodovarius crocodyli]
MDPELNALATEALRLLVDSILVFPGERRGEVEVSLRGDLAFFLQADAVQASNAKTAAALNGHGRSGFGLEVLRTLDAGTGFGLWRTALRAQP